jgi:hypothetical protein
MNLRGARADDELMMVTIHFREDLFFLRGIAMFVSRICLRS